MERRKLEDEPENGSFEPKWERTHDPHVDDYEEIDLGLFGLDRIP